MSKKLFSILQILLLAMLLCAFGPSEEALNATATQNAANTFGTQTAEAPTATYTPSPTDTPTATPTITPLPTLSLEAIVPTTSDLPPGFNEVTPEIPELIVEEGFQESFDRVFMFENEGQFELILGFVKRLDSELEQNAFDSKVTDPKFLANAMLSGINYPSLDESPVLNYMEISPEEAIGEHFSGASLEVILDGSLLVMDFVAFRRGDIGVIISVWYLSGEETLTDFIQLATQIDNRIQQELLPS